MREGTKRNPEGLVKLTLYGRNIGHQQNNYFRDLLSAQFFTLKIIRPSSGQPVSVKCIKTMSSIGGLMIPKKVVQVAQKIYASPKSDLEKLH